MWRGAHGGVGEAKREDIQKRTGAFGPVATGKHLAASPFLHSSSHTPPPCGLCGRSQTLTKKERKKIAGSDRRKKEMKHWGV